VLFGLLIGAWKYIRRTHEDESNFLICLVGGSLPNVLKAVFQQHQKVTQLAFSDQEKYEP
jgi:hypothetical protein